MPFYKSVSVSNHAVQRWRERAAIHANETQWDVLRAFEKAYRIADNAPVPVSRKEDSVYFHNAEIDCYFVLTVLKNREALITTVVRFDVADKLPSVETEKVTPLPEKTRMDQIIELLEEREQLRGDYSNIHSRLKGEAGKRERSSLDRKMGEVQKRLAEMKEVLAKFSNQERNDAGKIILKRKQLESEPLELRERREQLRAERERLLAELRTAHAWNEVEAIDRIKADLEGIKDQYRKLTEEQKEAS